MTKADDRILVQEYLAHAAEPKPLSAEEKARLEARIKAALKEKKRCSGGALLRRPRHSAPG